MPFSPLVALQAGAVWYSTFIFSGNLDPRDPDVHFLKTLDATLGVLPRWIFGVVWSILYLGNGFATYFYLDAESNEDTRTETLDVLWFIFVAVNLVANKFWTRLFFEMKTPVWALVDLLVTLLSAVGVLVIQSIILNKLIVAEVDTGKVEFTVAIILWILYLLWLIVAFVLNVRFLILRDQMPRKNLRDQWKLKM